MSARTPDDLHEIFRDGVNGRDLDRVAALYEDDAILVADADRIVRGRAAIREGLQNLLSISPTLTLNAARIVRNGDLALLYSDWTISGRQPDGTPIRTDVRPTLIARRQSDGTWRIAIDDPSTGDEIGSVDARA